MSCELRNPSDSISWRTRFKFHPSIGTSLEDQPPPLLVPLISSQLLEDSMPRVDVGR